MRNYVNYRLLIRLSNDFQIVMYLNYHFNPTYISYLLPNLFTHFKSSTKLVLIIWVSNSLFLLKFLINFNFLHNLMMKTLASIIAKLILFSQFKLSILLFMALFLILYNILNNHQYILY